MGGDAPRRAAVACSPKRPNKPKVNQSLNGRLTILPFYHIYTRSFPPAGTSCRIGRLFESAFLL